MKLEPMFFDFETYWSPTHKIEKLMPIPYVMHPDTEIQTLAVSTLNGSISLYVGDDIAKYLATLDWSAIWAIGHNMLGFDALILAWRFGVRPAFWGCTQAMAYHVVGAASRKSLNALSKYYGLGSKLDGGASISSGYTLKTMPRSNFEQLCRYNVQDTNLCRQLFKKMYPYMDERELRLIDWTTRMRVDPRFVCDLGVLDKAIQEGEAKRFLARSDLRRILNVPDISDEDTTKLLNSPVKFSKLLNKLGVPIPTKKSPTTGLPIPALAKTDEDFLALQEHPDIRVSTAVSMRLSNRDNSFISKAIRFREVATCCDGYLPVPLTYSTAVTGRWGGADGMNMQGLNRVIAGKPAPSNALRYSMRSPPGELLVVADLSGVELRINHTLWKEPTTMQLFRDDPAGADPYKTFAASLYNVPVENVTTPQRQLAKMAQLGLGFGAGATAFRGIAYTMGGVEVDEAECQFVVQTYRQTYQYITEGWETCKKALQSLCNKTVVAIDSWGLCHARDNCIYTPMNGRIQYPGLRRIDNGFVYGAIKPTYLYGAKVGQNIVQHLARQIITDQILTVQDTTQLLPIHFTHDEVVYSVKSDQAEDFLEYLLGVMRESPYWWPALSLWAKGGIGDCYGQIDH